MGAAIRLFAGDRAHQLAGGRHRPAAARRPRGQALAAGLARRGAGHGGHRGRLPRRQRDRRRLDRQAPAGIPELLARQVRLHGADHGGGRRGHLLLLLQPRQEQVPRGRDRAGPARRRRCAPQAAGDPARAAHAVQHAGQPARADRHRPAARRGHARPPQQLPARHPLRLARARASARGRVPAAGRLPRAHVGAHGPAARLPDRAARGPARGARAAAAAAAAGGECDPPRTGAEGRGRRDRDRRAARRPAPGDRGARHRRGHRGKRQRAGP